MDARRSLFAARSRARAGLHRGDELAGRYAYAGPRRRRRRGAAASSAPRRSTRSTTTTTSPGARSTTASDVWVVRKGATPAFPGQRGLRRRDDGRAGGDPRGRRLATRRAPRSTRRSTAPGARCRARRPPARRGTRDGVRRAATATGSSAAHTSPASAARVTRGARMRQAPRCRSSRRDRLRRPCRHELAAQGIELRGGAADEAPGAYKRLDEVLAAPRGHGPRSLHTLRPIGVAMAGADTFDPTRIELV